jgi:uncharacterized lipoprotein YajG
MAAKEVKFSVNARDRRKRAAFKPRSTQNTREAITAATMRASIPQQISDRQQISRCARAGHN